MKSMLSLTAAAVLCASTSFAQEAPAQTDVIQGQAGATTVDGQALADLGTGLGGAGLVGIVAVVAAVAAISSSDSSNGTN